MRKSLPARRNPPQPPLVPHRGTKRRKAQAVQNPTVRPRPEPDTRVTIRGGKSCKRADAGTT